MTHDMGGAAGAAMTAVMIVMMVAMGGFSLAFLRRTVPVGWQQQIRRVIRRPTRPAAAVSREDVR